jgi:hypothetical protein
MSLKGEMFRELFNVDKEELGLFGSHGKKSDKVWN